MAYRDPVTGLIGGTPPGYSPSPVGGRRSGYTTPDGMNVTVMLPPGVSLEEHLQQNPPPSLETFQRGLLDLASARGSRPSSGRPLPPGTPLTPGMPPGLTPPPGPGLPRLLPAPPGPLPGLGMTSGMLGTALQGGAPGMKWLELQGLLPGLGLPPGYTPAFPTTGRPPGPGLPPPGLPPGMPPGLTPPPGSDPRRMPPVGVPISPPQTQAPVPLSESFPSSYTPTPSPLGTGFPVTQTPGGQMPPGMPPGMTPGMLGTALQGGAPGMKWLELQGLSPGMGLPPGIWRGGPRVDDTMRPNQPIPGLPRDDFGRPPKPIQQQLAWPFGLSGLGANRTLGNPFGSIFGTQTFPPAPPGMPPGTPYEPFQRLDYMPSPLGTGLQPATGTPGAPPQLQNQRFGSAIGTPGLPPSPLGTGLQPAIGTPGGPMPSPQQQVAAPLPFPNQFTGLGQGNIPSGGLGTFGNAFGNTLQWPFGPR